MWHVLFFWGTFLLIRTSQNSQQLTKNQDKEPNVQKQWRNKVWGNMDRNYSTKTNKKSWEPLCSWAIWRVSLVPWSHISLQIDNCLPPLGVGGRGGKDCPHSHLRLLSTKNWGQTTLTCSKEQTSVFICLCLHFLFSHAWHLSLGRLLADTEINLLVPLL